MQTPEDQTIGGKRALSLDRTAAAACSDRVQIRELTPAEATPILCSPPSSFPFLKSSARTGFLSPDARARQKNGVSTRRINTHARRSPIDLVEEA
jgi:hypothetical protein